MKALSMLAVVLLLVGHVDSASSKDVCNCKGYAGPGGPCYAGPGGDAYDGPGGPAYRGPGGACYDGPGGPKYDGPGGDAYSGPGGPRYDGPGGSAYDGPGGAAYAGPGGACYDGPGGPCYSGPGGASQRCPEVCGRSVSTRRSIEALEPATTFQAVEATTPIQSTHDIYPDQRSNSSGFADRGVAHVTAASSEDDDQAQFDACISSRDQRTAAVVAQDWQEVSKRANASLALCKGFLDDQDLSAEYGFIATSANIRNRPEEALNAALTCLNDYYSNGACHVEKVIALTALDRSDDARTALDIAIRLIQHNIELLEQDLDKVLEPRDRELKESHLETDRVILNQARELDRLLQPK